MQEYVNMGSHPVELANGQPVGTGERVELSAEAEKDAHNKALIEDGVLMSTSPPKETKSKGGDS